jgi:hypothetical protein
MRLGRRIRALLSSRNRLAAFVLFLGLLVFLPNVNTYFLADDFVLLSWTRVDSPDAIWSFFDPNTFWFYRPGVKLLYWAGQSIFGLWAMPFHLFSLLLHGANAYLLYRLIRRSGGWWATALAAGLLFLHNPHHAETVSWVAATGDLIGGFCILSALLLFRRFYDAGNPLLLAGSLALFALGLFTRETVVMLPFLLLLDALVFRRLPPAWGMSRESVVRNLADSRLPTPDSRLTAFAAYAALLAVYLAIVANRPDAPPSVERGGLQFRALNLDSILLAVAEYVHGLVPAGHLLAQQSLDTLRILVWIEFALIFALALALWLARQRLALFGLAWMLLTPLLFIFFSPPTDRYFYLPSMGYAMFVVGLVSTLASALLSINGRGATTKDELPSSFVLRPSSASGHSIRWAVALTLAALLFAQGIDLASRVKVWDINGHTTDNVFAQVKRAVPEPENYAAFYLVDLPMFIDGVPAFQNSLPQAVQLMYANPTLAASAVTCDFLAAQTELPRFTYFFRYQARGVQQLPNEKECR